MCRHAHSPSGTVVGLALALVVLAVIGGCRSDTHDRPLTIAMDSALVTLDPHHHNETVVWALLCNIYDGLVRLSPRMELEPALAVSWERLDDLRVRFTLRQGVHFHTGARLTANDVVATFSRVMTHQASRIRPYLAGIRAVWAEDDDHLVIETEAPAPTLLNRLAFVAVVPEADARLDEIVDPVGTGPYRVTGRGADGSVELARWDGWHRRPQIERATFSFIDDEEERADRFLSNGVDVCVNLADNRLQEVEHHPTLRLELQPRLVVHEIAVCPEAASGVTRAALADPRVRRALLLAIDRGSLVDMVLQGNATVASQLVHPVVFGYDPSLDPLPYDPQRARELLADAGFADGFEVELASGTVAAGTGEALARDLAAIGVRVTHVSMPFNVMLRRALARALPLVYYGWPCVTGDASDFLNGVLHTPDPARGFGSDNYSGYSNPSLDALIEAADHELDRAVRLSLLQQAQRLALDELPVLPLTVRWSYMGVSDRVEVLPRHDAWLWVAGFHWRVQGEAGEGSRAPT